jgi:kynurenine formamidase
MKVIDLTKTIFDGMSSHFKVTITDFLKHEETAPRLAPPAKGYGTKVLLMCDHTATHVDAPSHYWPERKNIDEMPIETFCGEAVVLDFSNDLGSAGELSKSRFEEFLCENCLEVKKDDIVIFKFQKESQDIYSGLSEELAEHLAEIHIKMVGTDRGTIDCGFHKHKPGHVLFLKQDIPIIESLDNLDKISNKRVIFYGLPLKLKTATGSPIRAIAVL